MFLSFLSNGLSLVLEASLGGACSFLFFETGVQYYEVHCCFSLKLQSLSAL